ncbi:MAG TPA: hypothetical protein DDY13_03070 [Cytophagales bacterium]|nr:hypothetical protein [Cytophagales bacterium]
MNSKQNRAVIIDTNAKKQLTKVRSCKSEELKTLIQPMIRGLINATCSSSWFFSQGPSSIEFRGTLIPIAIVN